MAYRQTSPQRSFDNQGDAEKPGAARSDSMNESSNDLSQDLAEISDRFSELGERLLGAARQLHAPGTPPSEKLLEELSGSRRDFIGLRDRARDRAESLDVPLPSAATLDTIQGLTALLDLVAEAEIRQAKGEETRRRALAVVERVLTLKHSGEGEFAPLRDCQAKARSLRDSVAAVAWSDLPPEAAQLAEGDHPFAKLLALVEDREVLNDDLWASLHDGVGATFGKSLAAAAARAKLSLPPESSGSASPAAEASPPQSDARPSSGEKSSPGRRNLGKATPSSR
jgi:hypothetical protein